MRFVKAHLKERQHETLPRNIEENHETWIVFNDGNRDERLLQNNELEGRSAVK